ncbi:MAG: glycoside hydrolase family 130 protein [Bacilli bacterium]|nr:glycoside hydrolase family 130 protein [Bacilli bacterium]
MSKLLNCDECKNMPWQDRPEGSFRPVWRYSNNPITKREYNENIDRIFNSALVPFDGEFIGVFRADTYQNRSFLYVGHSKDGYSIELEDKPLVLHNENGEVLPNVGYSRFDPRVIKIEDVYYVVFCEYTNAVTTAIAYTKDFKNFTQINNPFTPNYRNGVLFPRKINDYYKILLRPCDAGNSNFGDIYVSESKDLHYWGNAKLLLSAGFSGWNWTKIGGGPAPIETDEGWLILIHGVTSTCSGWIYSMGGIIVDKDDPSKVLYRCDDFLLTPDTDYEKTGFTPNVVFPTSVICDGKTGRMAIYYGASDTYTGLAFTQIDILVDYIKKHSK